MNVLFIVDHAPDYREEFFRILGKECTLTVISHPCDEDGLFPPKERRNYRYIEIPVEKRGGFIFLRETRRLPSFERYDLLCVDFNPRHLWRIRLFSFNRSLQKKWVWWGHIYGRSQSSLLKFIRKILLRGSVGALVYSREIAARVKSETGSLTVLSINNSQARRSDFLTLPWPESSQLRFLFVGRPQYRKRLDRIVRLSGQFPSVEWRLIGPGMESYMKKRFGTLPEQIICYDKIEGKELTDHFSWCHCVINPGHIGLLISNAAIHGRGVIIQENENHAPEVILAEESEQIFIDFDDSEKVAQLFDMIQKESSILKEAAYRLQKVALEQYTLDHMVDQHLKMFRGVCQGSVTRWFKGTEVELDEQQKV